MKNRYEIRGDVTAIFLNRLDGTTLETLIDTADLPIARSIPGTWVANWSPTTKQFYVVSPIPGETKRSVARMHRLLTNAPDGLDVDHINHDPLDNRRGNLRVVDRKTNALNFSNGGIRANNTSGYRGVSWNRQYNKWQVFIKKDGKSYNLGRFSRKEDAARAYNEKFKAFYPELVAPNSVASGGES